MSKKSKMDQVQEAVTTSVDKVSATAEALALFQHLVYAIGFYELPEKDMLGEPLRSKIQDFFGVGDDE